MAQSTWSDSTRLDGPRLKVFRAYDHLQTLINLMAEYGKRVSVSYEPVEGDPHHKRLTLSEKLPVQVPLVIGDAVHNFRASIDILICDIARSRGVPDADKFFFPFAETRSEFERISARKLTVIGQDLVDRVIAQAAYKEAGGNGLLYSLHELDIIDKHRYVMPLSACSWGKNVIDLVSEHMPPGTKILGFGFEPSLNPEGQLLPTADADKYYPAPFKPSRPATTLFPDGHPLARKHVIPALSSIGVMVRGIIDDFSAVFFPVK